MSTRINIRNRMRNFGATETIIFAVLCALILAVVVILLIYTRPVPAVIPATTEENVVPATGEQGFNTKEFCNDNATTVVRTIAPDASGATYELKRLKNGVSETVAVVLAPTSDVLYAKHFWDQNGQQTEPAYVDDDAKRCIVGKAR